MSNNKEKKIEKVLLVEDEEVLLEILSQHLKKNGYEVVVARDGRAGLDEAMKKNADLILLDMILPQMDGYEILSVLQENNIRTPVIIISNSGQPVDIAKAKSLGALDYIVKAELNPDEIIAKIKACQAGSAKPDPAAPAPSNGRTVVLAEDDAFLRELCGRRLQKKGFQVAEAVDGIDAYEKIVSFQPKVVLLDVIMPGLEGFEVLKKVCSHANKKIAQIPIVLLSNLGQDTDLEKGLTLGANDYLIKANVMVDEIIAKIEKYFPK